MRTIIIYILKESQQLFRHKAETFPNNCFCYPKSLLNTILAGPALLKFLVIFHRFVRFRTMRAAAGTTMGWPHHRTVDAV